MRKLLKTGILAAAGVALPVISVLAIDTNLTAQASFRVVLTAAQTTALDFSPGTADIEFTGAPDTSTLTIATNNARAETGSFFTIPDATGQAGVVTVTGSTGEVVEVSCSDTVLMRDGGTNDLAISSIEYTMGAGAALAAATDCEEPGTNPTTFTLDGSDAVRVGGTIVANSEEGVVAGDYSTANSTDPIVVRTVYQ